MNRTEHSSDPDRRIGCRGPYRATGASPGAGNARLRLGALVLGTASIAPFVLFAPAMAAERAIEIPFAAEFAGLPFDCETTYDDVGAGASSVRVTDFRLFVSAVRLVRADGERVPLALEQDGTWQSGDVALLDFENGKGACDNGTPETNASVRGSVPEGDYDGVELTLGVPFDRNHADPTLESSPLNLSAMFWNWRGGYRFLKLDLQPAVAKGPGSDGKPPEGHDMDSDKSHGMNSAKGHGGMQGGPAGAWMLHVGSTGCASATRTSAPASETDCAYPNRVRMSFEGIDPDDATIVVDPAALLRTSNLERNAPDTSPGCMSSTDDADCAAIMPLLGIAWPWDESGDEAAGTQQLMRAR